MLQNIFKRSAQFVPSLAMPEFESKILQIFTGIELCFLLLVVGLQLSLTSYYPAGLLLWGLGVFLRVWVLWMPFGGREGTSLQVLGPYRFLRHPALAGRIYCVLGLAFMVVSLSWLIALLLLLSLVYRLGSVPVDLQRQQQFGLAYEPYWFLVGGFFPELWPYQARSHGVVVDLPLLQSSRVIDERQTWRGEAVLLGLYMALGVWLFL